MTITGLSRCEVLLSQFQLEDLPAEQDTKESLRRIFLFIFNNTDIYYLAFIREETLIQYLKIHHAQQFEYISFVQAVRDVKYFLRFLKNNKKINYELEVDLSLQNSKLWINL